MKKLFLLLFLISVCSLSLVAQKEITSGKIVYEVEDVSSDNPQVAQQMGMMKDMEQTLYFTPKKQKTTMNMMGGMMKTQVYYGEEGEIISYMDAMGQKMMMDIGEMAKNAEMEEPQVEYTDQSEEILGYDCTMAIVTVKGQGQEVTMKVWLTDKINIPYSAVQDMHTLKLEGTPLKMVTNAGPMTITMKAIEISDEVDDSVFEIPEGNYQELSEEQIKQMQGGF